MSEGKLKENVILLEIVGQVYGKLKILIMKNIFKVEYLRVYLGVIIILSNNLLLIYLFTAVIFVLNTLNSLHVFLC